jgi:hypothetical protein
MNKQKRSHISLPRRAIAFIKILMENIKMIDTSTHSVSQTFNVLEFEIEHSRDFQALQNTYTNYEIDSVEEDFGELFRVWNGCTLLGSLNENAQGRWTANPYYQDKQLIELDKDLSQTFDSSSQAVAYIKATYERQISAICVYLPNTRSQHNLGFTSR